MERLDKYIFICHDLGGENVVHSETISFQCDLGALNHALVLSSDYFGIDVYRHIDSHSNIKIATLY